MARAGGAGEAAARNQRLAATNAAAMLPFLSCGDLSGFDNTPAAGADAAAAQLQALVLPVS